MSPGWVFSTDVHEFLSAAGDFLRADPITNTLLLTEAAYLEAFPQPDCLFGWWGPPVSGAFLRAPRHAPIVTLLPDEAWAPLPPSAELGVDTRSLGPARRARPHLEEVSRVTIYRIEAPPRPEGTFRRATPADRELLVSWYHDLMAANPGDPSDLAYVVDFPMTYGGLTLLEVDGVPTAMAGRTPVIAGMTRVGAAYAPGNHTEAVLAAACAEAATVATDVLILGSHRGLEVVGERSMLAEL